MIRFSWSALRRETSLELLQAERKPLTGKLVFNSEPMLRPIALAALTYLFGPIQPLA